jgi:hypothetical protein
MGGIEECFLRVFGKEEILGSTTCRVLCLEMDEKLNYLYI